MTIASTLSPAIVLAAFIFTFVGFAAKSGIVPFHAWLPSAHSKAPAPISAILSGSVTSVGIYGIIRMYAIASQTTSEFKVSIFLIIFGVISMAIAALTIITQVNLKKVIAYSTVENMGFLLVGIGLGTPLAYLLDPLLRACPRLYQSFTIPFRRHPAPPIQRRKNGTHQKRNKTPTLRIMEPNLGCHSNNRHASISNFLPKVSILLQSAELSPFLTVGLLLIFLFVAAAFGIFLIKLLPKKMKPKPNRTMRH